MILERFWEIIGTSKRFSGDSVDSDENPEILIRFYEILDILVRFQRFLPSKWHEILTFIHPSALFLFSPLTGWNCPSAEYRWTKIPRHIPTHVELLQTESIQLAYQLCSHYVCHCDKERSATVQPIKRTATIKRTLNHKTHSINHKPHNQP